MFDYFFESNCSKHSFYGSKRKRFNEDIRWFLFGVFALNTPPFRIATIALDSSKGDAVHISARLTDAAAHGAHIAVFPQTCLAATRDVPEPADGPSLEMIAAAVATTGVAAGVGWIERTAHGRLYESYALCMPGGARIVHRKLQADHGRMHGGNRFTVFDTPFGARMAILIGSDNEVMENVRMTALLGATLLIAPQRNAARTAATLAVRAVDNGLFIAQSGNRDVIAAPDGSLPGQRVKNGMLIADIDPALAEHCAARQSLAARRPDLYAPLARETRSYPLAIDAERATPRGSLPLSFAIVGRNRAIG